MNLDCLDIDFIDLSETVSNLAGCCWNYLLSRTIL